MTLQSSYELLCICFVPTIRKAESHVWEESKLIIYKVSVGSLLRTTDQNASQNFGFSNYEEMNVSAWCVPL